ncbi:phosphotransferase [Planotetraspora phitsanulokensis]|uniref:Aminoglycoside phosphotransferase n=1 Tax=Planotetraspora phitsanulokensis TaxID=575192 RepID=A0A8J3XIF1_9ACTN|nr:phosphotransferase [Planotetraspora phitsanulokensis]GII42304.1 aminoglycoside phosphotransferase [Planotetraspora phitsanulokensis]
MLREDAASATLVDELVRLAPRSGPVTVLKDTRVLVVRVGDVVVKAHPPGTEEGDLRRRLDAAGELPGVMLAPLGLHRLDSPDRLDRLDHLGHAEAPHAGRPSGRLVTIWPAGEALSPDDLADGTMPQDAWESGARLLAHLHASPPPAAMPPAGGPGRLVRAMVELAQVGDSAETRQIREAYRTLAEPLHVPDPRAAGRPTDDHPTAGPSSADHRAAEHHPARHISAGHRAAVRGPEPSRGRRHALTHGDWHLGQLVRHEGAWLLIDPDDLGVGDPAWDLARPAAWFAAGLLDPELWHTFLSAYVGAGGIAVSPDDPWRELDLPARALTVQLAATATVTAMRAGSALDDVAAALVSSCGRIVAAAGERRQGEG